MGMTIENGAKEVADRSASTVGEAANIFAKGLLMGVRGNSGVITSQLFRGFSQSVKDKDELDGAALAAAFQAGVEVAYKAVMKPVERNDFDCFSWLLLLVPRKRQNQPMMRLKSCVRPLKEQKLPLLKHQICFLY